MSGSEAETLARTFREEHHAFRQEYLWKYRMLLGVTVLFGCVNLVLNWSRLHPAAVPVPVVPGGNTNQSVTVGSTAPAEPEAKRDWLTTKEVAREQKVEPRTVVSWIADGKLPAVKDVREYRIPKDYHKELRLKTADSGNERQ